MRYDDDEARRMVARMRELVREATAQLAGGSTHALCAAADEAIVVATGLDPSVVPRLSAEALVLFLYFARLHQPFENNLLENKFLALCFVSKEDLKDRLKKLSLKGYFNMTFNGTALNIELVHSYKGICDALYNRPQTEI